MYTSALLSAAALLSQFASAAPTPGGWGGWNGAPTQPFKFPLPNGFPNPSPDALKQIEIQAHGTLPNGPLPNNLKQGDLTSFQLIAFNEIFEVAYFSTLLANLTSGDAAYASSDQTAIVNAITAVVGQEQLHALAANAILTTNGQQAIQPCEYVFPVSDLTSALTLAYTFTDVVLGTLQDVQLGFGTNGDNALIPVIGGVIGQEGEQNGFYRAMTGKIPSALPFLTRSAGVFAYSVLNHMFIVPGSCPNANLIDIPILDALTVTTTNIQAADQTLQFSTATSSLNGLSLVYINQQNTPVVVQPENVQSANGMTTFSASFPYTENVMNGLTMVALTKSAGPFSDAEDVAMAAVAGPGIIEIN